MLVDSSSTLDPERVCPDLGIYIDYDVAMRRRVSLPDWSRPRSRLVRVVLRPNEWCFGSGVMRRNSSTKACHWYWRSATLTSRPLDRLECYKSRIVFQTRTAVFFSLTENLKLVLYSSMHETVEEWYVYEKWRVDLETLPRQFAFEISCLLVSYIKVRSIIATKMHNSRDARTHANLASRALPSPVHSRDSTQGCRRQWSHSSPISRVK